MEENQPAELPFLSNIGLMLTYKCTMACPHCIVEAGPHRTEVVDADLACDWIQQIGAYRAGQVKGLAFTGGECFYDLAMLARLSAYAQSLGLVVSVVTNAYWARSADAALDTLAALPAIQMLSFSTDVYHQRAVPLEHIAHAIRAARRLRRAYNIAVCTDNEAEPGFRATLAYLEAIGERDSVRPSITFPVGRALRRSKLFHYSTSPVPTRAACSMASSPVIFPDGKVIGCIGPPITLPASHPLYLGSLREEPLGAILDRAETNLILHALRVWGPWKLLDLLSSKGFAELLPREYIDNCVCDVCYKLLADQKIVHALEDLAQDQGFRETVAYGRMYYLNETRMLELFDQAQPCSVGQIG